MKKFSFFIVLLLFLCLNGCSITEKGESLHAFTERMNTLNESYRLTEGGYIYNEKEQTLSKFYKIDHKDYLLSFGVNDKNNLCSLNIVFDKSDADDTYGLKFIENCIYAYVDNDQLAKEILNVIKLPDISYKTCSIQEKIGNTEIIVDVTEAGTVITVVQNKL